jgi:serine/threonine protein phosphatase PrpC
MEVERDGVKEKDVEAANNSNEPKICDAGIGLEQVVVVEGVRKEDHGEDNGEDMSEGSSSSGGPRRDSNSSTEGDGSLVDDNMDDQDASTATTTSTQPNPTSEVLRTSQTNIPRRKKRKPRRKGSRSKSHSRSSSRQHQLSDPPQPATTPSSTTDSLSSYSEQPQSPSNTNNDANSTPTNTNTNAVPLDGDPNLLDLNPPPTRGRSNAFYGTKPIPVLVHSHSDGVAIKQQQSSASSSHSKSTHTIGHSGVNPVISVPEPATSGLSRPKLFNYWKQSFAGPGFEKAIISHSRRFMVGFAETIGRRPSMEDCIVIHGTYRGRGQEDYFAIFDGHGGRDSAAFAAEHLHQVLAEKLKTNNPVKSLREAFAETHKMIAEQKITGGTTAVVALFIGKKGFIANVGDTRAVLCRDGVPLRVSLDHKPELPTETMRIRKLGGTVTTTYNSAGQATSRVNGMLAVSRALGDTPLHPYVSCDPEIHGPLNLEPEARNQFVVLACDGVWDVLTDEEATSIVAPINNPEEASRRLRDEAFARGSTDNISVMVIRCPPFSPG